MPPQYIEHPITKEMIPFEWNSDEPPTDEDLEVLVQAATPRKPQTGATRSFEIDPMDEIQTNLEKTYRTIVPKIPPEEIAKAGVEALGMAAGAAGGAFVPVPGASLVGAGVGYAAAKRLANSVMGEPVDTSWMGVGGDVLLGGTLQGAANLVGKIPGVKKVFSPKEAAVGPESAYGAEALDKAAYATMEKSMKVPPSNVIGGVPVNRENAINLAIEEGIPITKGGLSRARNIMSDLGDQMDIAIKTSPSRDNLIAVDSVLGPVNELRDRLVNTVNGSKIVKQLDDVVANFIEQHGPEITVAKAQELKQNTGTLLKKAYGELQGAETESIKQVVRGLKDRIATEIPEITGINAKYSDMANLERVLERAVNRTGNWDWFSLSAGMAGAVTGGATGSMLKATEAVGMWRLLKSPTVQSRLAIALHKMGVGTDANVIADTITTNVFNKLTEKYQRRQDIR